MRIAHALRAALLIGLVYVLAGCSAATAPKRAAQTLETIAVTVDGGMQAAASFYKEGRVYDPSGAWVIVSPEDVLVSDAGWAHLADAHEKYRRAGKAAALAIKAAGPSLKDPAALLTDVNAAAQEVLALIDLFRKGNI